MLGFVTALRSEKLVFKNAAIVLSTASHMWVPRKIVHSPRLPYTPQTLTAHLYLLLVLDAEKSQIIEYSPVPPCTSPTVSFCFYSDICVHLNGCYCTVFVFNL